LRRRVGTATGVHVRIGEAHAQRPYVAAGGRETDAQLVELRRAIERRRQLGALGGALGVVARAIVLARLEPVDRQRRRIVQKWGKRFLKKRMDGLADDPRSGRPPRFSPGGGHASGEARV
jgi:hypothetical protein